MSPITILAALALGIVLGSAAPARAQLLSEIQQLSSGAAASGLSFGFVAIAGDTAVAADGFDVYVYQRDALTDVWSEVKLLTSVPAGGATRLAIDGDTIVVAAPNVDNGADQHRGAAYVFERDRGGANQWGLAQTLSVGIGPDSSFGRALSFDGTTLVIGVEAGSPTVLLSAAFVFERVGGSWAQTDSVVQLSAALRDLALDGDTLIFGTGAGAFVYGRDVGGTDTWGLETELLASDPQAGDAFGRAVAVDGDRALVSAPLREDVTGSQVGGVYVFERNLGGAGAWGVRTLILPADIGDDDGFGRAVALRSDLLLASSDFGEDFGAVYTFGRNQGGADAWGQLQKLTLPDPRPDDRFGIDLDLTGGPLFGYTAIVGNDIAEERFPVPPPTAYLYGNTRPQTTVLDDLAAPIAGGSTNVVVARVSDGEESPETLVARVDGGTSATTNGITVANLVISADGDVTADVEVACGASDASFELTIDDEFGLVSTSTLEIDTEPSAAPVVALAGPVLLGSPNHKYRLLSVPQLVLSATDDCEGDVAASLAIEQITSDEPDDAPGGADGNTRNDAVVVDCTNLQLRAERDELGNGRVYGITLRARDSEGSAGRAVFAVGVPAGSKGQAVEDAPVLAVPGCP